MSTNSLKELTVKVNPGNLGEITIKLVQEDGLMKASLKANSKETTSLLSQNLAEIKKQLGEQNIKISNVNIEIYQDDTTYFNENGFAGNLAGEQNKQNNSSQNNVSNDQVISSDVSEENLAKDNSNINMFA
jgi:flagellar hook-length control protein FliK